MVNFRDKHVENDIKVNNKDKHAKDNVRKQR